MIGQQDVAEKYANTQHVQIENQYGAEYRGIVYDTVTDN